MTARPLATEELAREAPPTLGPSNVEVRVEVARQYFGHERGRDGLLTAHIEAIGRLIEQARIDDVYDELLDVIEELILDVIRTRLQ